MTTQERLLIGCVLRKQAGIGSFAADMLAPGDTGIERGLNAFSNTPGIGFLGNLGAGAYNLARGRFKSALGDIGMGAVSGLTGGVGGYAAKALRIGGRLGTPTFGRGIASAVKGFGRLVKPVQEAGMARTGINAFAGTGIGRTIAKSPGWSKGVGGIGMQTATAMDGAAAMAPKNNIFDGITRNAPTFAGAAGNIMGGGQSMDPRFLTPRSLPAPISTMFS
jgi:hypothetical protein